MRNGKALCVSVWSVSLWGGGLAVAYATPLVAFPPWLSSARGLPQVCCGMCRLSGLKRTVHSCDRCRVRAFALPLRRFKHALKEALAQPAVAARVKDTKALQEARQW